MTKFFLGVAVGYVFHDALDGFIGGFTNRMKTEAEKVSTPSSTESETPQS